MSAAPRPSADAAGGPAPAASAPRVWMLLAEKQGDNAQVEALASALPFPVERRDIRMRPPWDVEKPRVEPTLDHLDPQASDPLEPPWPDLVLTVGRRPSMAALWIKGRSGGRTRIVLVGKPSGRFEEFDLVIGSTEIQLPPLPNVLSIDLPLLRVDRTRVERAAADWRERLAPLPRPLVAYLIGGPTGPFVFGRGVVEGLLSSIRETAARGGTPWVTTSRRTPDRVADALADGMPAAGRMFRWKPDAADNPYLALLGSADGFVVTGDSISMLVEVARLAKPLAIFPLPSGPLGRVDGVRRAFTRWLFSREGDGAAARCRRRVAVAVFRAGLLTQTRDFSAMHRRMVARGLAVVGGRPPDVPAGEASDDLAAAADRVVALLDADAPRAAG